MINQQPFLYMIQHRLSGRNDEITRLNSDVSTTHMNLVVVSSRVLHVLTYANQTPIDSPSCIKYVET